LAQDGHRRTGGAFACRPPPTHRPPLATAPAAGAMARTGEAGVANPFSMPPEFEFFWRYNPEQQNAQLENDQDKDLRVWEKPTAASKHSATRFVAESDMPMAALPASMQKSLAAAKAKILEEERPDNTFLTTIATKPAVGLVEPLRKSEKDVRVYVQKKREVFLAHMACDVKKAEIVRLEEKAHMKEEALAKSQQMLDEDTKKFEDFMTERLERASKTAKDAEAHQKRKLDKSQRIKQIRQQIAGVQSEIGKFREVREECTRYKAFLDKLTPSEWREKQEELKQARKARRREAWIEEHVAPILAKINEEERIQTAKEDEGETEVRSRQRGAQKRRELEEQEAQRERDRQARRKRFRKRRDEEHAKVAAQYEPYSSEEEYELFFKEPRQLMDTLTELEERNLFLIQTSQETEQMLDGLQHTFEHTKKDMGGKVQQLKDNIRQLERNISQEKRRCEELRGSYNEKAGTGEQVEKLNDLFHKVTDVYVRCGLSTDHDPDTLQMLAAIESKIEEFIQGLDDAYQKDADLVMRLEWKKDKERRERMRVHRIKEQMDKQEERLKQSLLRSQAPVFKKAGKQVMYRSPPLRQERRVVKDDGDDEVHARDHGVFGIYIDRKTNLPQTEAPVAEESRRSRVPPPSPGGVAASGASPPGSSTPGPAGQAPTGATAGAAPGGPSSPAIAAEAPES